MKTITTTNGTKIEFFNNSKEISARRWNAFNTECIKSSTLGNTFEEAASKLDALNSHLKYQNMEAYKVENENLRLQLYAVYKGINTQAKALIYLIKSIDGEPVDPFADPEELVKRIEETEISAFDLDDIIWEVRKK